MVCDRFEANPFKKDICKNCQKAKESHPAFEKIQHEREPCKSFTANPFKPDFCKECQQAKSYHALVIQYYDPVPVTTAPPTKVPVAPVPTAVTVKNDPIESGKNRATENFSAPHGLPPKIVTPVPQTSSAQASKPAPVLSVPTVRPAPPALGSEARNESGSGPCTAFQPNPFRPVTCKVCQKSKACHEPPAPQPEPVVIEQVKPNECTTFREHAYKKGFCVNCGHKHSEITSTQHFLQTSRALPSEPCPVSANIAAAQETALRKPQADCQAMQKIVPRTPECQAHENEWPVITTAPGATEPKSDNDSAQPPQTVAAEPATESSKSTFAVQQPGDATTTSTKAHAADSARSSTCAKYEEHAFKRNTCRNCGKNMQAHATRAPSPPTDISDEDLPSKDAEADPLQGAASASSKPVAVASKENKKCDGSSKDEDENIVLPRQPVQRRPPPRIAHHEPSSSSSDYADPISAPVMAAAAAEEVDPVPPKSALGEAEPRESAAKKSPEEPTDASDVPLRAKATAEENIEPVKSEEPCSTGAAAENATPVKSEEPRDEQRTVHRPSDSLDSSSDSEEDAHTKSSVYLAPKQIIPAVPARRKEAASRSASSSGSDSDSSSRAPRRAHAPMHKARLPPPTKPVREASNGSAVDTAAGTNSVALERETTEVPEAILPAKRSDDHNDSEEQQGKYATEEFQTKEKVLAQPFSVVDVDHHERFRVKKTQTAFGEDDDFDIIVKKKSVVVPKDLFD